MSEERQKTAEAEVIDIKTRSITADIEALVAEVSQSPIRPSGTSGSRAHSTTYTIKVPTNVRASGAASTRTPESKKAESTEPSAQVKTWVINVVSEGLQTAQETDAKNLLRLWEHVRGALDTLQASIQNVNEAQVHNAKVLEAGLTQMAGVIVGRVEALQRADKSKDEALKVLGERLGALEAKMNAVEELEALKRRVDELEAELKASRATTLKVHGSAIGVMAESPKVQPVPRSLVEDLVDTAGMIWHQTKATVLHPLTASTVEMYLDRAKGRDGKVRFRRRYKTTYGPPNANEGSANG